MSIGLCHWTIPSLVCPYLFWTLKSRTRIFIRVGDTAWHLRALVFVDNLIIISNTHIGQLIETHSLSSKEIQHFFWAQRPSVYMWYVHTLTYKHIYMNIHIYTETYMHLNTYEYICTKHTYIHTHIYIHTQAHILVCVHTQKVNWNTCGLPMNISTPSNSWLGESLGLDKYIHGANLGINHI